jgi:hypothetical protein
MNITDIPIKHGRYINARGQTCTVVDIYGERCDIIAYLIDGEGAPHQMLCTKFVLAWRAKQ